MINDLTEGEKHLAEFMSELSERCYGAGWMRNLEYVLWHAVESGPRDYGQGTITKDDIRKLADASEKVNAWILFDDKIEEISVPLHKWKIRFRGDTTEDPDILR